MAEGGMDQVVRQQQQQGQARRLNELFHGRFDVTVLEQMIEDQGGFHDALTFLMTGDQQALCQYLQQSAAYMDSVKRDADRVASILDNVIAYTNRQFACEPCDKSWWKRVPERKEVSKCFSCKQKYDPVPRDKEWGWGHFQCPNCTHEFNGFAIMGRTISTCFDCEGPVQAQSIFPPKKRTEPKVRLLRDTHDCNGVGCPRRNNFQNMGKPCVCIHPKANTPRQGIRVRVHYASSRHVSTGSTVDTHLSQGSLDTDQRSIAPSLATIQEEPRGYRGLRQY